MLRAVAVAVVSIFFLIFAVDNHDPVSIGLFPLPYTFEIPKFLLALGCFALGVVVGGFTVSLKLTRTRRLFKHERKRAAALQNELKGVREQSPRSLPVAGG
jgi:uncharacterized integral membrane protein